MSEAGLFRADQKAEFQRNYNRRTFMFDHVLHRDPAFALDNLAALAGRLPKESVYSSVGTAEVGGGWNQGEVRKRPPDDIVRNIGGMNALVMLKDVDRDPDYAPVFRQVMAGIVEMVGSALRDDMSHGRATLLISSPRRVTAYHIDAEVNYLLQIAGDKDFYVFDHTDRTLVSEAELEAYYAGDYDAARYRSERQGEAAAWLMQPGKGAHVPVNAPHWVQNHDQVSVSLSVNYDLRSIQRVGAVYRVNHKLRRAGLRPRGPGASPLLDGLKVAAFSGVNYAKRLAHPAH
jgi:hypothetical protein